MEEAKFYCLDRLIELCEEEIEYKDNLSLCEIPVYHSGQGLDEFLRSSSKLTILLSFERVILWNQRLTKWIEILLLLDSDRIQIIGCACRPSTIELPQWFDMGLYDPVTNELIKHFDGSDTNIPLLLTFANKYGRSEA
jgi:hypothetical protein